MLLLLPLASEMWSSHPQAMTKSLPPRFVYPEYGPKGLLLSISMGQKEAAPTPESDPTTA